MNSLELAQHAAKLASDKKAFRIKIQDLRGFSDLCEFQLVCSGSNAKQAQAICDNIQVILKNEHGMQAVAIEGKGSGQWILMDYGNTIIHVFSDQIRDYYALESLWPKAKFVAQKDEVQQSEA